MEDVLGRGKVFTDQHESETVAWRAGRRAVFALTGLVSKLVLHGLFDLRIHHGDVLAEALAQARLERRGVITVINHTSVLDEPLLWGILPMRQLMRPADMRWALGADNVCFKTPISSTFFMLGQVLKTYRGGKGEFGSRGGIFQGAVDASIYMLTRASQSPDPTKSHWISVFPEALVHQVHAPHNRVLRYFHWGVSRMILEPPVQPIVVPIYTHGLEEFLPEDRLGWYTSIGHRVEVNIGDPVSETKIGEFRQRWARLVQEESNGRELTDLTEALKTGPEAMQLRSELATYIRQCVLDAQRAVTVVDDEPQFNDPLFWHTPRDLVVIKK